ncbi:glycosyltransferase family 87 protein [Corynebacterium felinum]|uniref:Arabinofuranan 3-O-arabinosyltransferase n=1 Tax=Corynebacterium felinum TaxID=131318 RepID=A0ABU2BB52_9CORY|nr:glycosyltransferase family 87 protein [Corynebacterium felinum]MDF5821372.1 glycosyltransferase family 87 protein [Corynebacterium felinum]MDR7355830.1 arabinofuranan 3-O-arabinosyltransferase [Corynebacterium felinum]WJY95174.1 Alpha-(1->3)-arabinofuranosyltransferase [Corynebacterium felinum]
MTPTLTHRLQHIWTSPHNAPTAPDTPQRTRIDALATIALWPIAILTIVHRVFFLAANGSITDDYTTVYQALRRHIDGIDVYSETYYYVDPHYLYNPGATLLLSPLAYFDNITVARMIFIIVNALAIIAGLALLTRLFHYSLKSAIFPVALTIAFLTEAVQSTLIFANINGILFLALTCYIWALHRKKSITAVIIIGLAILIKPIFLPLLFLPFIRGQISTIILGIGVPAAFNLLGWFLVPGANNYIHRTIPYLKEVRNYANASMRGFSTYFSIPSIVETGLFILFALTIIVGIIFLLRIRNADPLVWMITTTSLLLTGVFFLSALGQMYYSILLFPLLFTVLRSRSVMHSAAGWLGAFFSLTPFDFTLVNYPNLGRWLNVFQATTGWAILIIAISATAILWWWEDKAHRGNKNRSTQG